VNNPDYKKIELRAVKIANAAIRNSKFSSKNSDVKESMWNCAFHHAMDLLLYSEGLRLTTRCLATYETNDVEENVEIILSNEGDLVKEAVFTIPPGVVFSASERLTTTKPVVGLISCTSILSS
jgi:hypothetical protein